MVRKCQFLTFAMATAMVAGGAFAADKAVKSASAAISQGVTVAAAAGSQSLSLADIRTVTDVVTEPSNLLVATCSCHGWDNGYFTNAVDAVGTASHFGGAFNGAVQAADDVYLNDCSIWKLNSISADFITNSQATANNSTMKAVCEIYADCNGCPSGRPLYTLTDFTIVDANTPYLANGSYRIVTYKFSIGTANTDPRNRAIALHGGVYWISIYKLSDNIGCTMPLMKDASYWGATAPGVKGSTPKTRSSVSGNSCTNSKYTFNDLCGPTGWHNVSDCCFGCRDLNFVLCADECPIYINNGIAAGSLDAGASAGGSPSQFAIDANGVVLNSDVNSRTADDFPVPNCSSLELCYIEGCIYTNCVLCDRAGQLGCFVGSYEIYGNVCLQTGNYPNYSFSGSSGNTQVNTGGLICHGDATQAVDLGFDYTVTVPPPGGGQIKYRAYKLEFFTPGCTLPGGFQYWISIGARYNFTSLESAFFCYNYDCTRPNCLIRWNDGKYLAPNAFVNPVTGYNDASGIKGTAWVPTGHDFSFLIAGTLTSTPSGSGGASTTCAGDFNKDGKVTAQDLFDFLSAWFAGACH